LHFLEVTNQTVNVSAFTDEHNVISNIPIVTAATEYDNPATGTTYILVLGQCIYMGGKMPNSLLCPNQLRSHGIVVDECPQHLAPPDQPSSHSIYCRDDDIRIPLNLKGVTSGFISRTPTIQEIETCQWIHLNNEYDWDPHSEAFAFQEESYNDLQGYQVCNQHDRHIYNVKSSSNVNYATIYSDISSAFDDNRFIAMATTSNRGLNTTAKDIAKKWNVGLDLAKKTLKCTTQKGVHHTLFERRFCTKQAQLCYRQLSGRHGCFYTDTFFSSQPLLNGCKMGQLYINDLSFMKFYPMKAKSDAPDTLVKFIQDIGIPHAIHSDDTPELTQGRFKQICKDYQIHPTFTEPYSPWQYRAEGGIRELKRMVHRKMTSKHVPLRLWDFCCKWVCEIKNKSANDIYAAEDRTPYEATLGQTFDMSSLLPFDFYDVIWYHEETASFPEPRLKIGR
jgi:hypothetical protein